MTIAFVDLFAGAGGLSLGLQSGGWTPSLAIDHWADAVATYERNFDSHPILPLDISDVTGRVIRKHAVVRPDWVVGGPPCQGFSTVGKRQREDPRNFLVKEFARVVSEVRAEGFLIENVLGLRDMKFVASIKRLFRDLGYQVTPVILRAADFGVPQLRHRIVFVGDRRGRAFVSPPATHNERCFVTVWDAIGDLPTLNAGESASQYTKRPTTRYQKEMRDGSTTLQGHEASRHPEHLIRTISFIPDGGNRRDIPNRFQPRSGFHNSYSRLNSKAPAVAVTQNMGKPSGTRCIHPFQHRGLTAREGARLQSFPDSFHFVGGMTSQRLQVANAVPPRLAAIVAQALASEECWSDPATAARLTARWHDEHDDGVASQLTLPAG